MLTNSSPYIKHIQYDTLKNIDLATNSTFKTELFQIT